MAYEHEDWRLKPFVPIFLGIRDHQRRGAFTPMDHSIYVTLHEWCDFETGICETNAAGILWYYGGRKQFGARDNEEAALKQIQASLARLRDRKYVNYETDRSGNIYPILIHKYWVRTGPRRTMILDAFAHGSLKSPAYVQAPEQVSGFNATAVTRGKLTWESSSNPMGDIWDSRGSHMGLIAQSAGSRLGDSAETSESHPDNTRVYSTTEESSTGEENNNPSGTPEEDGREEPKLFAQAEDNPVWQVTERVTAPPTAPPAPKPASKPPRAPSKIVNPAEFQQVLKRTNFSNQPTRPAAPEQSSATGPTKPATTPGARIASRYFDLLEIPEHRNAAVEEWPRKMAPLLENYSEADVIAAMKWALTESDFWPEWLIGAKDPAGYFVDKAATIFSKWRGQARKTRNAQKNAASDDENVSAFPGLYNEWEP